MITKVSTEITHIVNNPKPSLRPMYLSTLMLPKDACETAATIRFIALDALQKIAPRPIYITVRDAVLNIN
jgi:hypothetical protein